MNKEFLFLENLYTLLDAGYSIEESLNLCDNLLHYSFIETMKERLKMGESIDSILNDSSMPSLFKEYFSFYQNKNCLSEAIEKSLSICQTQKTFIHKLKSQLTYPIVLLIFLFLFSIFVVLILLPNVNMLFESFQIQKNIFIQCVFMFFHIIPYLFIMLSSLFIFMVIRLLYGLKHKKFKIIEKYLKIIFIKVVLKKYFSLKFAVYYQELSLEGSDSATIIRILNQQMIDSDIKIVLYEMNNRLMEGESLEIMLNEFEYFDELFVTFFKMYLQNAKQHDSLTHYIQLTYQQMEFWVNQFLKYVIPCIYAFVAVFVITIYISIVIPMMNIISDI